jgi:hypothetical protein
LKLTANGFPLYISPDDAMPQPIDVTEFLVSAPQTNVFDFTLVKTSVALGISIREYRLRTISMIARRVPNLGEIDLAVTEVSVRGPLCAFGEAFPLSDFLAVSLATGNYVCPVCGRNLEVPDLVVIDVKNSPQV